MERRDFLKKGSLAGLSLSSLSAAAESADLAAGHAAKASGATSGTGGPGEFALLEATIDELQKKMANGELSSRSITSLYLQRIAAIDQSGPTLRSVIEVNPDALSIADALDNERKANKLRGPLHGIPVLVKDNIDTGDKMMTTAGSLALEGNIASKDAFIIQRLRAAGAVLLGKTNLSEWANFRSERSTSGWSSRGGQTKCPYILDRNPSGSSAGSGSAVAANLCTVAIGTETDGSIICPSSVNGLVGIKPTVGLWSRSGIIPISATQDTAGPMARTVKDAAILLGALTGVDENDPVTRDSTTHVGIDYTKFLTMGALKGKRIGIERSYLYSGHEGIVAMYRAAIDVLKKEGAEIVEIQLLKQTKLPAPYEFRMMQYEFRDGVNRYLAGSSAKVRSLSDVIAFNKANESRAMPYFKQETLEDCDKKIGMDNPEYLDALKQSTAIRAIIDSVMTSQRLDAISSTSNGPACCIDLISGDYDTGYGFTSPAARAGYPHITVPMGTIYGLPVGFSFMAGAYQEGEILAMAYHFEQVYTKRTQPQFLKNYMP